MKAAAQMGVGELREEIKVLTSRWPVSKDARYLRGRLNSLRQRRQDGEDVTRSTVDHVVTSISMPRDARDAVGAIMERRSVGFSDLARRALAEWAARNGFRDEAKLIDLTLRT